MVVPSVLARTQQRTGCVSSSFSQGPDQPQGCHHAEFYCLKQIRSRNLDQNQHYRLTCFISWSPCYSCAHNLTTFLKENCHISLRIFASRLYTSNRFGCYQRGLRELQAAGAQITIMTSQGRQGSPGGGAVSGRDLWEVARKRWAGWESLVQRPLCAA